MVYEPDDAPVRVWDAHHQLVVRLSDQEWSGLPRVDDAHHEYLQTIKAACRAWGAINQVHVNFNDREPWSVADFRHANTTKDVRPQFHELTRAHLKSIYFFGFLDYLWFNDSKQRWERWT